MVQKKDVQEAEVLPAEKKHKLLQGLTIKLKFKGRVYGSLPKDKELLTKWIESKANRPHAQGGPYGDEDTLEEKFKALGLTKEAAPVELKADKTKDTPYQEVDVDFEQVKTPDKEGIVEE